MRTEEQVLALFAEANRVPDPKDLDVDALTGHLSAIEQRRKTMTKLDEKRTAEERRPRRGIWRYAIAGAVVLAAIVAIGFAAANSNETEAPVATQPVAPPEVVGSTMAENEPTDDPVAVSEETIVGEWETSGGDGGGFLIINPDGTLQRGQGTDGEGGLFASGTWTLEGDVLTFTADGTAPLCEAGEIATMTLSFSSDERLKIAGADDPCWSPLQPSLGYARFGHTWTRTNP